MRRRNKFCLTLNSTPLHTCTYLCHQNNMRIFREQPRKTWNYKRYRQSSSPIGLIPRATYQNILTFIGLFVMKLHALMVYSSKDIVIKPANLWKEIAFTALILELSNVLSVHLTVRWIPRNLLWSILSADLFNFQGQWHSYFLWSLPKMAWIFQT